MAEEKPRFLMLIGIAGSGKSTVAKELMNERNDIIYLSSDALREELLGDVDDQSKQADIFQEMAKRTKEALKNNIHVIYDATNVSRKKRKGLLQQLPKDIDKVACFVSTEYKDILDQNMNRERTVPHHVIDRMYKTMQIPIYSEGWDKIVFFHHDNITANKLPEQFTDAVKMGASLGREGYGIMGFLASYFDEFFGVYDLAQDSKYHSLSVSRHIYYVYRHVLENWDENDFEKDVMIWTALLHDVGKAFCKNFYNRKGEETRYANFIGHENVGSQMALHFLHKLNFEDEFIHKVATLIQFHMYLLDENANRDKLINQVGEEMFEKLEFLRDADTLAH
jgi:putative nucleotidyltransferase with HDIG domain